MPGQIDFVLVMLHPHSERFWCETRDRGACRSDHRPLYFKLLASPSQVQRVTIRNEGGSLGPRLFGWQLEDFTFQAKFLEEMCEKLVRTGTGHGRPAFVLATLGAFPRGRRTQPLCGWGFAAKGVSDTTDKQIIYRDSARSFATSTTQTSLERSDSLAPRRRSLHLLGTFGGC